MNRITWKESKRRYSNGEYGYRNRIRCFFLNRYAVTTKKDYECPILLDCYLTSLKANYRFKTVEKAKELAEEILEKFIKEVK